MPIKGMWHTYKIRCIEAFLSRAFLVRDRYTEALSGLELSEEPADAAQTDADAPLQPAAVEDSGIRLEADDDAEPYPDAEADEAFDILLGYEDIVLRAVYSELNALVELELTRLAKSILDRGGEKPQRRSRRTRPATTERSGLEPQRLGRGSARSTIEETYCMNLRDLPGSKEVEEVREITNAYKHRDGLSDDCYEEAFPGLRELFGEKAVRYKLSWEKASRSIEAVRVFLQALPGERQEMPEERYKPEDAATIESRRRTWEYLRRSGALGHDIAEPMPAPDGQGGYVATCKVCGKVLRQEFAEMLPITASVDRCPGAPELRRR